MLTLILIDGTPRYRVRDLSQCERIAWREFARDIGSSIEFVEVGTTIVEVKP